MLDLFYKKKQMQMLTNFPHKNKQFITKTFLSFFLFIEILLLWIDTNYKNLLCNMDKAVNTWINKGSNTNNLLIVTILNKSGLSVSVNQT